MVGGGSGTSRLERSDFAGRIGETFVLDLEGVEGTCDLQLSELLDLGGKIGTGEREEPFTLRFRGPRKPRLPQLTYRLHHPDLGRHDVFLVPIAEDAEARTYEAVFT